MSMRKMFEKMGCPAASAVSAVVGGVVGAGVNAGMGAFSGYVGTKILLAAGHVGYDVQKSVIDNVVGGAIVGGGLGALGGCAVGTVFSALGGSASAVTFGSAAGGGLLSSVALQTVEGVIGFEVLKAAMDAATNATTESAMTLAQEAAASATGAVVVYGGFAMTAACCACIIACCCCAGALTKDSQETIDMKIPNVNMNLSSINVQMDMPTSLRFG
jgi:hypothetical protein